MTEHYSPTAALHCLNSDCITAILVSVLCRRFGAGLSLARGAADCRRLIGKILQCLREFHSGVASFCLILLSDVC